MDLEQARAIDPEYADKFAALFESTGVLIREHLKEPPPSRDRVYRVLNVLAAHAATVIVATDDDQTFEFFMRSLLGSIQATSQDHGIGPIPVPKWENIAKPDGSG